MWHTQNTHACKQLCNKANILTMDCHSCEVDITAMSVICDQITLDKKYISLYS